MHEFVKRIKDPELCYVFARNARRSGLPDLALQAHRRAVDLRAESHPTSSEAEFAAVRAIYAYEEAMSYLRGKRTRATGTWQLVNKYGLLPTVLRRIQGSSTEIAPTLAELGMSEYSFEAVGSAYPEELQQAAA